jgi:hypothetical protein
MVDMDILVHPEDIPEADSILRELGYEQIVSERDRNHPFHEEPYRKMASFPIYLELHWSLDDRKLVNVPEIEIWRRAQPVQLNGINTFVLSSEDNLLFLANHLFKHSDQLLRFLIDIAELIRKYEEVLDWEYIVASAHSWEITPAIYYALIRARQIVSIEVPDSVIASLRPKEWRRCLLDLLVNREMFICPFKSDKLNNETSTFIRSLMMKRPAQVLLVLSRQHEAGGGRWARIATWAIVVVLANFWRYLSKAIGKRICPLRLPA